MKQLNNCENRIRSNTQYQNSQQNQRSRTPKNQTKLIKYNQLKKSTSDPPGIDRTESSELHLNHIQCEYTDDESETENPLSINMLHIKEENETIIESNYYQNKEDFNNFYFKNYTKHGRLH